MKAFWLCVAAALVIAATMSTEVEAQPAGSGETTLTVIGCLKRAPGTSRDNFILDDFRGGSYRITRASTSIEHLPENFQLDVNVTRQVEVVGTVPADHSDAQPLLQVTELRPLSTSCWTPES